MSDETIKQVEKLLGQESNPWCKECGEAAAYIGHAADCPLRKIRPAVLAVAKADAAIEVRKNINRQRIFKSDKPRWSGMPGGGKTLVKRKASKNRGPHAELKKCQVCGETQLFVNLVCSECQHERPCDDTCEVCCESR